MIEKAVVLGASGGIGKAVVDALIRRNIPTNALVRSIDKFKKLYIDGKPKGRVDVLEGDLNNNQSLAIACENVDTIFVCFNAPYYRWDTDMVSWIDKVAKIASALEANIVFPGNIYNYGHPQMDRITEEHPLAAHTVKGKLRISMEHKLYTAALQGASLTVLRFGDFFGPAVMNKLFKPIFMNAIYGKKVNWYGDPQKKHEFMFIEDAGEAMVRCALEPKARDTVIHVSNHYDLTSDEFIKIVYRIARNDKELPYRKTPARLLGLLGISGNKRPKYKELHPPYTITPNWMISLLSFFNKEIAEFKEMLYLYEEEILLDSSKFKSIIGDFKFTPPEEAIKKTLDWFKYTQF